LSLASDNCQKIKPFVEKAFKEYTDIGYWYGIAQAKKESNCRWVSSLDGHGSVGYFQLTPKFVDVYLRAYFPNYTKPYSLDHFYATAYYLRLLSDGFPSWVIFQRYNGGDWVLKECKGIYNWEYCKKNCRRGFVCVYKKYGECLQFKSACDINYQYSLFIYKEGQAWKTGDDKRTFWR